MVIKCQKCRKIVEKAYYQDIPKRKFICIPCYKKEFPDFLKEAK